jgi:hypothetical protein
MANSDAPPTAPNIDLAAPSGPAVQWQCKTFALDSQGKPSGDLPADLTVGTHFGLACDGPPANLKSEMLRIELPKETPYSLRILETKSFSETKAEFVATTWVAGEIKLQNPILTDGSGRISMGPIALTTKSVIDPSAKDPKPFPPWGPASLGWPITVWLILAALIGLVVCLISLVALATIKRRRLRAELEKNAIPTSAYNHFNKELRTLVKRLPLTGEWTFAEAQAFFLGLDQAFRWYLTRDLILVSGLKGRARNIAAEIRKNHEAISNAVGKDLSLAILEITKARDSKRLVSAEDASQILELCRSVADKIEKAKMSMKGDG